MPISYCLVFLRGQVYIKRWLDYQVQVRNRFPHCFMTNPKSKRKIHESKALFGEVSICSSAKCVHSFYILFCLNFRRKLAERSEASLKVSEFTVSSEGKLTKGAMSAQSLWSSKSIMATSHLPT